MQDAQRIIPAEGHAAPTGRAGGAGAANPDRERPERIATPQFVDPWRGC